MKLLSVMAAIFEKMEWTDFAYFPSQQWFRVSQASRMFSINQASRISRAINWTKVYNMLGFLGAQIHFIQLSISHFTH